MDPVPRTHPDLARLGSRSRSRVADALARIFDPILVVTVTLLSVGAVGTANAAAGLAWATSALAFCSVIPEIALRLFLRRRGIADRYLVVREQRHLPLLITLASVLLGLVIMWLADAPWVITATILTVLLGTVVMTLITRWWKASFHTAVASAMGTVLWLVVGPETLWLTVPVTLILGWARIRAGRHSAAQVAVGLAVGAACAAAVFTPAT